MKYVIISCIFSILIFECCNTASKQTNDENPHIAKQKEFSIFLKKFRVLKFPVILKSGPGGLSKELDGLPEFSANPDSLFLHDNYVLPQTVYYGMLSDTVNFYGLLIVQPAEGNPVSLVTFDKLGKQIDSWVLDVGECGARVDLEWCSKTTFIRDDRIFTSVDSIQTVQYDSAAKPIKGSEKFYVKDKVGMINPNGTIAKNAIR